MTWQLSYLIPVAWNLGTIIVWRRILKLENGMSTMITIRHLVRSKKRSILRVSVRIIREAGLHICFSTSAIKHLCLLLRSFRGLSPFEGLELPILLLLFWLLWMRLRLWVNLLEFSPFTGMPSVFSGKPAIVSLLGQSLLELKTYLSFSFSFFFFR